MHGHHAALGKILGDKLRCAAPGHDVQEICLPLLALLYKIPVARNAHRAHAHSRRRGAQFRVSYQPPHNRNNIQHDK